MRVKYEVKMTFVVEEAPDNPFPVDAFEDLARSEDDGNILSSRVEHTREVLDAAVDPDAGGSS